MNHAGLPQRRWRRVWRRRVFVRPRCRRWFLQTSTTSGRQPCEQEQWFPQTVGVDQEGGMHFACFPTKSNAQRSVAANTIRGALSRTLYHTCSARNTVREGCRATDVERVCGAVCKCLTGQGQISRLEMSCCLNTRSLPSFEGGSGAGELGNFRRWELRRRSQ